jgi:murein tripeptide amidase MpaA
MSTPTLTTLAEQSNFRFTGRTDEVERLASAYAATWPNAVRSFEYGRSGEGRPLRAMLVTQTEALTAAELHKRRIPLLMLQGGIHPGESDGKDAGFIALRELLENNAAPDALKKIAILFVPAFNSDGHERFGRWNRPNQVGPEEMGWRTNAQNLNLNRDYMKAEAPEMQAMLRLLNEWDPLICADLHVTDGADFEPDISIQVEPIHQGDSTLFASGIQLRDELIAKLAAQGSVPLPFYPDLFEVDNPASGFLLSVYGPRFSTGYHAARNRFSVLVETHSWKDYATRVRVTRNTIIDLVELVVQHGATWLSKVEHADQLGLQAATKEFALDFPSGWREPTAPIDNDNKEFTDSEVTTIDFRGYAYTRAPSAISGDLVTVYDPKTPQIWRVPFRKNTAPSLIVKAPAKGYIVPAGYSTDLATKFALHGIEFEVFEKQNNTITVEAFRATRAQFSTAPFEGRMRVTLDGKWASESREVPANSLFVPIAQRSSRLAMALLEPQAPDSLAAWGFFNGCFEQKEHIEPYVAEQIAREMMKAQPALSEEFLQKLKDDPEFAASPNARFDFFLSRHASWDERFNLYPIYRI